MKNRPVHPPSIALPALRLRTGLTAGNLDSLHFKLPRVLPRFRLVLRKRTSPGPT